MVHHVDGLRVLVGTTVRTGVVNVKQAGVPAVGDWHPHGRRS